MANNDPLTQYASIPEIQESDGNHISVVLVNSVKPDTSEPKVSMNDSSSSNDSGAEIDNRKPGGGKAKQSKHGATPAATANRDDRLCLVCGDRALGCNFDAISCESCKAFFRRNALKDKQTKCIFEGNCKVDVNTRRFCPHCRLKKCFDVGMKKELILGEDEKKKRLERVLKNKKPSKKSCLASPTPVEDSSPKTIPVFTTPPSTPGSIVIQQVSSPPSSVTGLDFIPQANHLLSLSSFMESTDNTTTPNAFSLLTDTAVSLLKIQSSQTPLEYTDGLRVLTPVEENLLQELIQVYDLSFTVDLEPLVHIKQLDPSLSQLVNQSSITVLRLIKFAKRLEEFAHLDQQCQIGILKGCWIHIILLRSVSVYDCARDVWATPRGDIPTEILKNATGFVQLHDDHVQYCKSIKSIIGDDLAIVIILLVIVLFSPEGPHVIARELVSNIQDRYLILLKHYLEAKYSYAHSAEMFPQLMSKVKELKEFAEVHGRCLVDINPSEIEPIMLEILDLK